MPLQFHNIAKSYSGKQVLDVPELSIAEKGITAILGPSGCGKTTLLRIVAGLETADRGSISWKKDDNLSSSDVRGERIDLLAPAVRDISFAMQQAVITPQWTVEEHWRFPLEQLNLDAKEIATRIESIADTLELSSKRNQKARELSGGEQQRVSLGRAMIRRSRCLLLDEPLSQVDRPLRLRLQQKIREEIMRNASTAIWVTHDVTEVMAIADNLVVMSAGRVLQIGSPQEIRNKPASEVVAELVQ